MMFSKGLLSKGEKIIRCKTEALAADAAADEQLTLVAYLKCKIDLQFQCCDDNHHGFMMVV